jgi:hypothetical protein
MYDATQIPSKHEPLTASSDEFGQYGSIFASDTDRETPKPLNLYNDESTVTDTTSQQAQSNQKIPRRRRSV